MKIQGGLPAPAAEGLWAYQPQPYTVQAPQKSEGDMARRFDNVTISADTGRHSVYEMDLRSRITQEVRTATSSGMINELRDQILSGAYQPDPMAIARKMMLLGVAG